MVLKLLKKILKYLLAQLKKGRSFQPEFKKKKNYYFIFWSNYSYLSSVNNLHL